MCTRGCVEGRRALGAAANDGPLVSTLVETSMTDADLVVALHFALNGSPEGHRVETLETQIATLKEVVANAKAAIEQRRQEADVLTSQMAEQLAPNDKRQAELDQLRAGINTYWQQVVRNHL
jgi:peptidoglycan hydrolase CwlO-like protein